MDKMELSENRRHPLLMMTLIFLIFFIPVVLAWIFYVEGDNVGEGKVNRGELIQPPRDFSKLPLKNSNGSPVALQQWRGKWLLLYVAPDICAQACQKNLYEMRQIRTATGKNQGRVVRALLTFKSQPFDPKLDPLLQTQYNGTQHFVVSEPQFQQVMTGLASTPLAIEEGYLYLVDPLGNIMMAYSNDANPSDIFKDLGRLLRVSQIG